MAREYCLMCAACKEFMDIHKFPVPPDLVSDLPTGIQGIQIGKFDVQECINLANASDDNHQWLFDLVSYINTFITTHLHHDLRIVDDSEPNYLWWPEHKGYTEWKELPTGLDNELFLPRNLIEDLKISDWIAAEEYLKSLKVILYDELELGEYKNTFNQLIRTWGSASFDRFV